MLRASGATPFWQARLAPIPAQPERGELPQLAHDPEQVAGEDALAEVAQLDHEDDTVDPTLVDGGRREQAEHGHLGVHADVGVGHDPADLAGHGRADQRDRSGDARVAQGLDVLDPGVAEAPDPGPQKLDGHRGGAERALGDGGDGDAAGSQSIDEGAGVVVELAQVDLEPRSRHRTPTAKGSSISGKAARTMLTSSAVGRLRASVAGMPSSAS